MKKLGNDTLRSALKNTSTHNKIIKRGGKEDIDV